jgi:hypothetical protein
MRYVQKCAVIEAFQFGVDEYPEWFLDLISTQITFNEHYPNFCCKIIMESGIKEAYPGDMIVKYNNGNLAVWAKDVFDIEHEVYGDEGGIKKNPLIII